MVQTAKIHTKTNVYNWLKMEIIFNIIDPDELEESRSLMLWKRVTEASAWSQA